MLHSVVHLSDIQQMLTEFLLHTTTSGAFFLKKKITLKLISLKESILTRSLWELGGDMLGPWEGSA